MKVNEHSVDNNLDDGISWKIRLAYIVIPCELSSELAQFYQMSKR